MVCSVETALVLLVRLCGGAQLLCRVCGDDGGDDGGDDWDDDDGDDGGDE